LGEVGVEGVVWQNQDWLFYLPNETSSIEQLKLYNKLTDPGEKNNVAKDYPELTQLLYNKTTVLRSYNRMVDQETNKLPNLNEQKLDPRKIKRLQKEGYF
jgi:hypothetical protein